MLFAVEAMGALIDSIKHRRATHVRRLFAAIVGGLSVAAGSIVPQYLAWDIYCNTELSRPWCSRLLPSIYAFVQEAYW
jgi:phosphatidylinositol glycan class V